MWLEYAPPKVSRTWWPSSRAAWRLYFSFRHLLPGKSRLIRSSRFRNSRSPARARRSSCSSSSGDGSRSSIGTTGARDHIQPPYSFAFPFAFAGGATVRRSGFGARLHLPPVVLTGCAAVVVARVAGPGVGQGGGRGGGKGGGRGGRPPGETRGSGERCPRWPPSRPLLHFSAGERANYDEGVRIVPDGWWLGRAGDVRAVCGYAGAAPAMSGAAFRVSGSPIGRCIPAGSGGIQLCACRPVRRRALVWPSARESILRCQFGRAGRVVLPPRRTLLARSLPR